MDGVPVVEAARQLEVQQDAAHLEDHGGAWTLAEQVLEHVHDGFVHVRLGLRLEDAQDVELLEALDGGFGLLHVLFQDEAEVVNEVPDKVGRGEDLQQGHQLAADAVED